jgi:replicative DNA helicase
MTDPDDITRALPHAIGPEKSILSSMLQDPQEFIPVAIESGFHADHLYLPAHQTLYGTLLQLHDAGKPIELVSLTQHLLDNGLLDRCGGPSTIADLYTYAPSPGYFRLHLAKVKDKHILRSLVRAGNAIVQNAYDTPDAVSDALDTAEREILAIRDQSATRATTSIREAVEEVVADMTKQINGDKPTLGIETGYPDLDRKTSGLKPTEMFVIAARPSVGKSALMMNIIEHITLTLELPAAVFSCEMSTKALIKRSIGGLARYSWGDLNEGKTPNKIELQRLKHASDRLNSAPLYIDDTPNINIAALRAKARRLHRAQGIQIIAVDYLQLLKSTSRQADGSREREVAEISSGLKALAKELNIPIVVLAQLNRESEKRTGKGKGRPKMSDLRESGAIEQDADIIGLLSREAYSADTEEERNAAAGAACLDIAKNRTGATGSVYLTFIPEIVRFEQSARPEQQFIKPRTPNF